MKVSASKIAAEERWLLLQKNVLIALLTALKQLVLQWSWQNKLVLILIYILVTNWDVNCDKFWMNGLSSPIVQFSVLENC